MADRDKRIPTEYILAALVTAAILVSPFVRVELSRWRLRRDVATSLAHTDPSVRVKSIRALETLGSLAAPALLDSLVDADGSVRGAAARALARCPVSVAEAVLDDDAREQARLTSRDRNHLVYFILADADAAIANRVRSENPEKRFSAILLQFGFARSELVFRLRPGRPIYALADRFGADLPAVLDTLTDRMLRPGPNAAQRQEAARRLGELGEPGIDVLVANAGRGRFIRDALVSVGYDAVAAVAMLAMNSEADLEMRLVAVDVLGLNYVSHTRNKKAGFRRLDPATVRNALTTLLRDEHAKLRRAALIAFGHLGKDAHPAADAITALIGDDNRLVRAVAIQTTARLGFERSPAMIAIIAALNDDDTTVRNAALSAAKQFSPSALPLMEAAVATTSAATSRELVKAIAKHRDAAVPTLQRILAKGRATTRRQAAFELGAIGAAAHSALDDLRAALQGDELHLRHAAIQAIARIGARPEDLDAMIAALNVDATVAFWAIKAIERITPLETRGLDALVDITTHTSPMVRAEAARALGGLSESSVAAYHALCVAARDDDPTVSWAALWAVLRLDPTAVSVIDTSPHPRLRDAAREFGPGGTSIIHILVGSSDQSERTVLSIDGHGREIARIPVPKSAASISADGPGIAVAGSGRGRIDDGVYVDGEPDRATAVAARPEGGDVLTVLRGERLRPAATEPARVLWRRGRDALGVLDYDDILFRARGVSLALTGDGYFVLKTAQGIYRVQLMNEMYLGSKLLPRPGAVAANPRTAQWAAIQRDYIHLFDADRERARLKRSDRSYDIAYSPKGILLKVSRLESMHSLSWFDEDLQTWRSLCQLPGPVASITLSVRR